MKTGKRIKMPEKDFSKIKTKLSLPYAVIKNDVLRTFASIFLPLILQLENELYYDENKRIPDVIFYIENNTLYVAGVIPKDMELNDVAEYLVYSLMMYINQQPQRGINKIPHLWMDSCHKLNEDLYHQKIEILKTSTSYIHNSKIIETARTKSKNYSYEETYNYKILLNTQMNSSNDLIQMIQQTINSLSGKNSSNSQTINDMIKNLMNIMDDLAQDGSFNEEDLNNLKDNYKNSIKNNELDSSTSNQLNKIIKKLESSTHFNKNYIQHEWQKLLKENNERLKSQKTIHCMVNNMIKENFEKIKGNIPGEAVEYLKKILKLKLPWDEILKHALNTYFDKAQSKTWLRPNIYYRHIAYLPSDDMEETLQNITLFIDTSGSMNTEELKKVFGIVKDVADNVNIKTITIIQHDMKLQNYEVIELDSFNIDEFAESIKIYGRGGTSHIAPFQKFIELLDQDEIPYPDLILFCSDFESDFEHLIKDKIFKDNDFGYFCITTYRNPDNVPKNKIIKIK